MSIQRRPDGRYRARIYIDGKERAKHFDRRADAVRWETEQKAAKHRGQWVDPSDRTTVTEYARLWASARPYRPSTARNVESLIKHHIEATRLGSRRLVALRPSEVQAWASDRAQHMSPLRLRNLVGLLKAMLNDATLDRLIAANPVQRISIPSPDQERIVPITPDQVQAIIEAIPPRNKAMVLLLATSGLRLGELLGLRLEDIDFLRRTVRVEYQFAPQSKIRTAPKTPKSRRTIPLPTVTLDALAAHIKTYGTGADGSLFITRLGSPYRHDYFGAMIFKDAVRRAKDVPDWVTPHACRHFYASQLLEAGESVATVAERLGHGNAGVTLKIYSHMVHKDPETTRTAMDRIFGQSLGPIADQDRQTGL